MEKIILKQVELIKVFDDKRINVFLKNGLQHDLLFLNKKELHLFFSNFKEKHKKDFIFCPNKKAAMNKTAVKRIEVKDKIFACYFKSGRRFHSYLK